jgi:methyl-accepting chemotaxis protein
MKLKSIQGKIAVIAGTCLFVTAAVLIAISIYSASSAQKLVSEKMSGLVENTTIKQLEATAAEYALSVSRRLEEGLSAARALANAVSASKSYDLANNSSTLDRTVFNDMLIEVLKSNPDLNGTYSCWEPDAFDGNDNLFKGSDNGSNQQTGRFTPYWLRDVSGNPVVQPLVEYDSLETHPNGIVKGAWFQVPKKEGHETVTAPLPYVTQGKQVWLATLSVPVIANGQFLGVVGTDYNLDFVQNLSEQVSQKIYQGQSVVAIVSADGLFIANSQHPQNVGKSITLVPEIDSQEMLATIKLGQVAVKEVAESNQLQFYAPITLGNTGKKMGVGYLDR